MEKKYQIFISSTYTDLKEAREKVIETILKMYHLPVGMEMFSADDDEQWQVIKDTIDSTDYYIVIIGHRYGSLTSEGISFSEKEYDYAKEKNVPILAFIRSRDVAVKEDERESDPEIIKKLNSFIEKARSNKMCDFWTTVDDLATKVALALLKYSQKRPRTGWIRADKVNFEGISEEIAVLSKENRQLREELDLLRKRFNSDKPQLSLLLNNEKRLILEFKKIKNLPEFPSPVSYNDIPKHLHKYVTNDQIEVYNRMLPTEEEFTLYRNALELYIRKKFSGQDLRVAVINDGTDKASDIYIDIEMPEEVIIIDEDDLEDLKAPDELNIPEHPLHIAEKGYEEAIKRRNDPYGLTRFSSIDIINSGLISNLNPVVPSIARMIASSNRDYTVDLNNNILTIQLDSLLHTRQRLFGNGYKLVALKPGCFKARIRTICAEYKNPEEFEIPIIINESHEFIDIPKK